MSHAMEITDII